MPVLNVFLSFTLTTLWVFWFYDRLFSIMSNSQPGAFRLSQHTLRQLKFVLPGGFVTYLLDTHTRFWRLIEGDERWARISAWTSLMCGLSTICLFLYMLLLPWIKGLQPDYAQWRQSGELSRIMPVLTALVVTGWPLLSFTLGTWTDLGFIKGLVASSGIYALAFGLIGLLPSPGVRRKYSLHLTTHQE